MLKIFKFKHLRNTLLVCLAAVIAFPLINYFYVYPRVIDIILETTKDEAVQTATHLVSVLIPQSLHFERDSFPSEVKSHIDEIREHFTLKKVKVFSSTGEIVYSTDPADVGTMNERSYFRDIVAKGQNHAVVARKNAKTLEGETQKTDVVETYIPIMRDGIFIGAFEIYYDITAILKRLGKLVHGINMLLFVVALGLIGTVIFASQRAAKAEELQEKLSAAIHRQMEELFAIYNSLDGAVYVSDIETYEILAANEYCEIKIGSPVVGKSCYETLHNYKEPCSFCTNHLLVGRDGEPHPPVIREFQDIKTGKWHQCIDRAINWPDGRLVRMEIAIDITEHKLAKENLKMSTEMLSERVKELNCLYAISSFVELPGISLEEICQGTVDLIPSAWRYPEITCARIVLGEREFRTANFEDAKWKQRRSITINGKPHGSLEVCLLEEREERDEGPFFEEERNLLNAIADRLGKVAERVRIQEALQESEKSFRDLVENSPTGIMIIQDDHIVYQNPELERLTGPISRSFSLTHLRGIHPGDRDTVKQQYQNIASGKLQSVELEFRFLPAGKSKSPPEIKWVYCRGSSIEYRGRDAILINMMDITWAKEMERLLRIQDKMSSLGRVAAGLAHEIRNPLSGINIYTDALRDIFDRAGVPDKTIEILEKIYQASGKIESVINRVMDFSKPSEPKLVLADINKPIAEAIKLSSVSLRKRGISVEQNLAGDLPKCRLDSSLIEQVILNLITNASDAMESGEGQMKLEVTSSVEGSEIIVRVSDSGPGVPPHVQAEVFDPFYTTKEDSTGIGLSICNRIVTDHGGHMGIGESRWGGAEFVIAIPAEERKSRLG